MTTFPLISFDEWTECYDRMTPGAIQFAELEVRGT